MTLRTTNKHEQFSKPEKSQTKETSNSPPIILVNNERDWEVVEVYLDEIIKKEIKVLLKPNIILLEQIFTEFQNKNRFVQVQYDSNSMSHMILKFGGELTEASNSTVLSNALDLSNLYDKN